MTVRCIATILILLTSCSGSRYLEEFDGIAPGSARLFYNPEQVTAGNEDSFAPDLSPNAEYVVYTSNRKGNKDLWEKRVVGGFARQLTFHSADDFSPAVSPDGHHVAFVSRRNDAMGDVHVLDVDEISVGGLLGGREGDVLRVEMPLTEDRDPAWYPDGKRLVFTARAAGEGSPRLMTVDLADGRPQPLANLRGHHPTVSPDGRMVAFARRGALFIHHLDTGETEQITDGGLVQDGEPRFTSDGRSLLFIRYADDTSGDGKLDGDDRPTIWSVDLQRQRAQKVRENYGLTPLTSARFGAYSPQIHGHELYFALQTTQGLNVFRLPDFGQIKPGADLLEVLKQVDSQDDPDEKTFVLRRATTAFAVAGRLDLAAETALMELDRLVAGGRAAEATWAQAKLKANFAARDDLVALSELSLIDLSLRPLAYPAYTKELTVGQQSDLDALKARTDKVLGRFPGTGPAARRVRAKGLDVKGKIVAAERRFFDADKLLGAARETAGSDRALAAEAAFQQAEVTTATAGVAAGVAALRDVLDAYPEQHDVDLRAAHAAVDLLDRGPGRVEALVALRTQAKNTPLLPALAHLRIAEIYREQNKSAVAANELRQIVDLYPNSPEVMLTAAERLAPLEEKAGRFAQAEAMLVGLRARLADGRARYQGEAKRLYIEFLLRRGEDLVRQKELVLGLKSYEKVLALEPLNLAAHRGKIDVLYLRGGLADQVRRYEAQADAEPTSAEKAYIYGYAKTYDIDRATSPASRLKAIDDCIEIVGGARRLDSQVLEIHQTLGWLYLQRNFTMHQYQRSGSLVAGAERRAGIVADFFGAAEPDWREKAIDAFEQAYYLSRPWTVEREGLAQNLGNAYYSLKLYQKSLAYYAERVRALAVIPTRDPRLTAVLFERAGRSAFQTDDLALAESFQTQALAAWEGANNDDRVAHAIDALALTKRELGKYGEALDLYLRLERLQRRLPSRLNYAGTLTSIGYCAYMSGKPDAALPWLDRADRELDQAQAQAVDGQPRDGAATAADESVTIDLGGEESDAHGFDLLARKVLVQTVRAGAYAQLGRPDLALAAAERKLALLEEAQATGGRNLAQEISILENNIGGMDLAAGRHVEARAAFRAASDAARTLRPAGAKAPTAGEVLNDVNRARVELRLASLGLLPAEEAAAIARGLETEAQELRPGEAQGGAAQRRPFVQLLTLAASLRAASAPPGHGGAARRELVDALDVLAGAATTGDPDAANDDDVDGTFLAWMDVAGGDAAPPAAAAPLQRFRERGLARPELAWKILASEGDVEKAYQALARFIDGGGVLRSPTDRQAARLLFERLLAAHGDDADPRHAAALLRRDARLRLTELGQRAGIERSRLRGLLPPAEAADALATLAPEDAVLLAHRTLEGRLHLVLLAPGGKIAHVSVPVADGDRLAASAYARALALPQVAAALPPAGGRLYVVPDGELYDVPWESVAAPGGGVLGQRYVLAYLPAVDLLSGLNDRRRLPKFTLGHLVWGRLASGATAQIKAANVERDYEPVPVESEGPLAPRLASYDLVHADAPLYLDDVEPGFSVLRTETEAAPASAGRKAGSYVDDLPLNALAGSDLPETTALVFANVRRDVQDLAGGGEGHDGWRYLSLAAAAAGVPTVITVERPAAAGPSRTAPLSQLPGPPADWQTFYQALTDHSPGEAARLARLPGRVLGYAGIPAAEEVAYARDHLDKAMAEADGARTDEDFDTAASAYKRAHAFALRSGRTGAEDAILDGVVASLVQAEDYAGALHYKMKKAARLKPIAGAPGGRDPLLYGRTLVEAADIALKDARYGEAERLLTEAERIFADAGQPIQLGKVWQYRGATLEGQRQFDESIAAYRKAGELATKEGPAAATAQLLNVANVYRKDLNDYPKALAAYDLVIAEYRKLGRSGLALPVLIDRADTQMVIGDLDGAISTLELETLPKIDARTQPELWARAAAALAKADFGAGLYRQARQRNVEVLAVLDRVPPGPSRIHRQIDAIALRGAIRRKLGRYRESFDDFRAAIALADQEGAKSRLPGLYDDYGVAAREYGEVDRSIDFFNTAHRLDEALSSRVGLAYDERNLAMSVVLKGQLNRARDLLAQALKESEALDLAANVAACHLGLADLAMRQSRWDEAEGHFEAALTVALKGSMQDSVWRARAGIAAALAHAGKADEAEAAYADAVATIERLRAGLQSEPSRDGFYADAGVQEVYEAYAKALMTRGKVELAWSVSERARARAFIDSFGTHRMRFPNATSAELFGEERRLRAVADELGRRLDEASPADRDKVAAELAAARDRHAAHVAKMRAASPELAAYVAIDTITKEDVGRLLGRDTALVEYQVTPDALLVWVLRDGTIVGRIVPVAETLLTARIRDFRAMMENFSTTDYLGKDLATLLLEPVKDQLRDAKRLVIVPHQGLQFLSFAALPWEGDQFVLDRFSLVYLDSATMARYVDAAPPRRLKPAARILALADPATSEGLPPLPFAGKEAEAISRYFQGVRIEKGTAATKAAVTTLARDVDVLHFAVHGRFDPSDPVESSLVLAPSDKDDGNLSVAEIFGLATSADLVTLSACETGRGHISAGNEIVGMDRAFIHAGATTVVASLWRISDVASAVTMKRFYRYLAAGEDRADALRHAQLVVRRYFQHPAYWAAFRLLGADK